jgi:flagellar M-ring protein FliF
VALVIVTSLIRPALKAMLNPPVPVVEAGSRLNETVGGGEALPAPESPTLQLTNARNSKLEQARAIARENPAAVAQIVQSWVQSDA